MPRPQILRAVGVLAAMLLGTSAAQAELPVRQMESLGRGVIVLRHVPTQAWVSWRLLGTEPNSLGFNVYRTTGDGGAPVKLNDATLTGPTHFLDTTADFTKANRYTIRAVIDGKESGESKAFVLPADAPVRAYLSVPLKTPDKDYVANDATVADLDGDGEYEIILKQERGAKDNSQAGKTDPVYIQAYKLDGTLMWQINLGVNIRAGAHYTQMLAYDFDGDGRGELIVKTADGTIDGTGKAIGDANADFRNEGGYILRGPEYLTVFDGLTGRAVDTVPYEPSRVPNNPDPTPDQIKAVWGDGYGNRLDRFLGAVAYFDGVHPSAMFSRGYYTRSVLAAWDYRGGKLVKRWVLDSAAGSESNRDFGGQGNHNLSVADVNGDGLDEIIFGAAVINADGTGRVSTKLGHGDAIHVSQLDPSHPGPLVARIQERVDDAGLHVYDPNTGEVLWRKPTTEGGSKRQGPGRGVAFDIDPRHPGAEVWSGLGGGIEGIYDIKGNEIVNLRDVPAASRPAVNMAVWWDGDDLREILDGTRISKWDWENSRTNLILDAKDANCVSINGTKANPCIAADLLGDYREEIVWRTADNSELRIFSTTIPTQRRLYTLMHDPVYRLGVAWQNIAYNQPPHTGFFFGHDMPTPPQPRITLVPPPAK
jgi:rhamnogalacturonan endolyase